MLDYDPRAYPPAAVTVDVVLLTIRDDMLMALAVRRGVSPYQGQLALPGFELGLAQFAIFRDTYRLTIRHYSSSARDTNFVRIGSLCDAKRIACCAEARSTPAISNITRPGFTTATHFSGGPLPLPILVSAGFLV